jgi:outer membrane autotransporter protein
MIGIRTDTSMKALHPSLALDFDPDRGAYPPQFVAMQNIRLAAGPMTGSAPLAQGTDFLARKGVQAEPASDRYQPRLFAMLSSENLKYNNTLKVDEHLLVAGVATGLATDGGDLALAAFIEYGEGDYSSRQHFFFGEEIKGKGEPRYRGGGVIGRLDTPSETYLEGSLRGGVVNTDVRVQVAGFSLNVDIRNRYFGAHLGAGKLWKLGEHDSLDTYTQALWSGGKFVLDSVDSRRIKVGARLNHAFGSTLTGFTGLAYDYEFSGKARSRFGQGEGYEIASSGFKGKSTVIEAGLSGRPRPEHPLHFDFSIQAHMGKREGVTGNIRANYSNSI